MNFVSAYLIMQKADADDPFHPKQEEEPKSWFKRLFQEHPMDFPNYMGVDVDLEGGRTVTKIQNWNTRQDPSLRDDFEWIATQIDDFQPSAAYWVKKENGTYISPGPTTEFSDVNYYMVMSGSQIAGRYLGGTRRYNGSEQGFRVWATKYASVGKYQLQNNQYIPTAYSKQWAFAIPCTIKLPVFENNTDGTGYSAAATAYYQNPTQANYETLCSYIDLCNNPDG